MSTLADRVRGIVGGTRDAGRPGAGAPGCGTDPPPARDSATDGGGRLPAALGGTWQPAPGGRVLVVKGRWSSDARYGAMAVGDVARQLERAATHLSMIAPGSARAPLVFFDLETTGLSSGAGTYAFLVGCATFDRAGAFVTRQYVLPGFADERAMLEVVAEELRSAGTLVSFNGKSFDGPVLETRYLFHRLDWVAGTVPHLDVLHPARRFWGKGGDPVTCSLAALERLVLGASRDRDVPGFEIPGRYFTFVRSGDPTPLCAVLEHNRRDLLSLAGLTARLLQLVAGGALLARSAGEALALGRVYERGGDPRFRAAFERALGLAGSDASARVAALRALAHADRRARLYRDAARRWLEMLGTPGCPPHVVREASQALAVHHEHRLGDLEGAKAYALTGLSIDSGPTWQATTRHRLARLERKMTADASETLLFPSSPWPPSRRPSAALPSGCRTSW